MKVTYLTPAESVSTFVKQILVIELGQTVNPFVLPLFANGMPTLLFSTSSARLGETDYHLTLFGQTIHPQQLLIRNSFTLIAYFLQPHALGALFNIAANELTDQPVSLEFIHGGAELQEQLLNAATTKQRLQIIDHYLCGKIVAIRHEDKRLIYAAEKIANTYSGNILTTVQKELHITERTFQRMFVQQVGVSPNAFRRISQFSKAFQQMNTGKFQDLSAVAYNHGYADQSHFIRTFKEFTHLTPTAYLGIRPGL